MGLQYNAIACWKSNTHQQGIIRLMGTIASRKASGACLETTDSLTAPTGGGNKSFVTERKAKGGKKPRENEKELVCGKSSWLCHHHLNGGNALRYWCSVSII